jgi:hypothetical protein
MAGAAEVDVLRCFCTGDSFCSSFYERINDLSNKETLKLEKQSDQKRTSFLDRSDEYERKAHEFVPYDILWWERSSTNLFSIICCKAFSASISRLSLLIDFMTSKTIAFLSF